MPSQSNAFANIFFFFIVHKLLASLHHRAAACVLKVFERKHRTTVLTAFGLMEYGPSFIISGPSALPLLTVNEKNEK